jgi:hypothetical protein
MEPDTVMSWLRELAADGRWRVREGVAIALQRIGRENMPRLLADMQPWSADGPFVQRAVVVGLCEPPLLKNSAHAVEVLMLLDRITSSLEAAERRRDEDFRVLRLALGYGWSVAAAAAPENAWPYFEKWLRSKDKDVAWVMKTNLEKARMAGLRAEIPTRAPAKPKAKPKPKPKAVKKPAKPAASRAKPKGRAGRSPRR